MAISNSTPRYYNPRDVILVAGGTQFTDFMPGTMIAISKTEDLILPQTGVRGETALAVNLNNTGTMTISLKQTSPSHTFLMAWQTLVRGGGIPYFPIVFNDRASNISITTYAWVQTQPDFTLGSEVASLEWVLGLHDMQFEAIPGLNSVVDAIAPANTD